MHKCQYEDILMNVPGLKMNSSNVTDSYGFQTERKLS